MKTAIRFIRERRIPALALAASSMLVALLALSLPATAEDLQGNPVIGAEIYRSYCRSCHGETGKGDGPVGQHLTVEPADLTQIARRNDGEFPTEWVFRRIDGRKKVGAHGPSEMPVWGEALSKTHGGTTAETVQQRISDLVAYIGSIQQQ